MKGKDRIILSLGTSVFIAYFLKSVYCRIEYIHIYVMLVTDGRVIRVKVAAQSLLDQKFVDMSCKRTGLYLY